MIRHIYLTVFLFVSIGIGHWGCVNSGQPRETGQTEKRAGADQAGDSKKKKGKVTAVNLRFNRRFTPN